MEYSTDEDEASDDKFDTDLDDDFALPPCKQCTHVARIFLLRKCLTAQNLPASTKAVLLLGILHSPQA